MTGHKLYIKLKNGDFEPIDGLIHSPSLKEFKKTSLVSAIVFYQNTYSKNKSIKSQKNEKKYFERLLEFSFEKQIETVDEIKHIHIILFTEKLSKEISDSSINRHFNTYKNFFKVCFENNFIIELPTQFLKQKKVKSEKKLLWTEKDYSLIFENLQDNDRQMFDFLWHTGCRPIELSNLLWTDVDYESGKMIFKCGKNAEFKREFPINDKISKILHQIKMSGLYVFTKNKTKYTTDSIYKVIKKKIKLLIPDRNLEPYGIRHTFATNLVKRNINAELIRILMGHKDFRTTQNYLQIDINSLKKVI